MLRVISNEELDRAEAEAEAERVATPVQDHTDLAAYVRQQFEIMRNHRQSGSGWNDRMLRAQRMFNGEYDPQKLHAIRQFGGSEVYARLVAVKCRGASSLLRDVYLGSERSWGVEATPDPTLPDDVASTVYELVEMEVEQLRAQGHQITSEMVRDRTSMLLDAARHAAKRKARTEAEKAQDKLDNMLVEGGFYKAFAEFLVDLTYFPLACLKGPVVRVVPDVHWEDGQIVQSNRPRLFWERVSPFDLFFTPGVSDIEDADIIERVTFTRADLNSVMDLPGYDQEAVRRVLTEHGAGGLYDFLDPTDSERAVHESRENPWLNRSNLIHGVEFHGSVQGKMLLDFGFEEGEGEDQIADPLRDYHVVVWQIGRHVIKVQISPSPRRRHPYFITSYEKIPGTPVGNAIPDILEDLQEACNATLRSLINNLSISSGPQVVINTDRLSAGEDPNTMYPWKRWRIKSDPLGNTGGQERAIDFFQPNSNAQELLGVYEKFSQMADEISAIPRYVTGSERLGGAGRTASGLAMLMGNAAKVLQTVAANIDRDVMNPLLQSLYDMIMLTDEEGILRGDEAVRVRGVGVAIQKETDRMRQIEFLQMTANPIDTQIMGPMGRAEVLRSVSSHLGMDGSRVVPPEDELRMQMQQGAMQPPGQEGPDGERPGNDAPGAQERTAMQGVAG